MAHFLMGMAVQLSLLLIFTYKSDALVFGFLLLLFLSVRWVSLNSDKLTAKKKAQPIEKSNHPLALKVKQPIKTQPNPAKIQFGRFIFSLTRS